MQTQIPLDHYKTKPNYKKNQKNLPRDCRLTDVVFSQEKWKGIDMYIPCILQVPLFAFSNQHTFIYMFASKQFVDIKVDPSNSMVKFCA